MSAKNRLSVSSSDRGLRVPERLLFPMILALLLITGFQIYWLLDSYKRESTALATQTGALFPETLRSLRDSILEERLRFVKKDTVWQASFKRTPPTAIETKRLTRTTYNMVDALARSMKRDSSGLSFDSNANKNPPTRIFFETARPSGGDSMSLLVKPPGLSIRGMRTGDRILLTDSIDPRHITSIQVSAAGDRLRLPGDSLHPARSRAGTTPPTIDGRIRAARVNRSFSTITLNSDDGQTLVFRMDSLLREGLDPTLLHCSFARVLEDKNLSVPFTIEPGTDSSFDQQSPFPGTGLYQPYELKLGRIMPFVMKRLSWPILFSVLLITLTTFSFILLWRSLVKQYRLSRLKNDLISNITHELKTPIATVGVAIEALRNFNALQDSRRTEEYLDISAQELARLGLLVDKVLKLSMFESRQIELQRERVNLAGITREVSASLRLQLEKQEGRLELDLPEDLSVEGDRLHLLSVVFNLMDNALKYSRTDPVIRVSGTERDHHIELSVSDQGIGIPVIYREKVFDKFFRVPHGDKHNAKGHGLGLSYVASVLEQHGGSVELISEEGSGSTFTIKLPKYPA